MLVVRTDLPSTVLQDIHASFDRDTHQFKRFWQIAVKICDACALRCAYCTQYAAPSDSVELSLRTLGALLCECTNLGLTESLLITGGEPLAHSQWTSLAKLLGDSRLPFDVNTSLLASSSRLATLIEAKPRTIRFSLHTDDEAENDRFTGRRSWRTLLQNADLVANTPRRKYRVEVNSSVTRANFRRLPQRIDWLCERFNVDDINLFPVYDDHKLQLAQGEVAEYYRDILPKVLQRSRSKGFNGLGLRARHLFGKFEWYDLPRQRPTYVRHHRPCFAGSSMIYIDNFGDIYPCVSHQIHRTMSGHVKVGSIYEADVWRKLAAKGLTPCRSPWQNEVCRDHCPMFFAFVNEYVASI